MVMKPVTYVNVLGSRHPALKNSSTAEMIWLGNIVFYINISQGPEDEYNTLQITPRFPLRIS